MKTASTGAKHAVGIFGGSFDPVHRGHLALVQYLLAQGVVEEVWLMVSPLNPLKSSFHLSPDDVRLDMARTAAAEVPGLRVSDFEMHLPRPSYTWRTLRALRAAYPATEFSLIIGADNWVNFSRWAHHDDLLAEYPLLVYPREGYPISPETLPTTVQLIDAPLFPFSSTNIRARLSTGEDVEEMLPHCIIEAAQHIYAAIPCVKNDATTS